MSDYTGANKKRILHGLLITCSIAALLLPMQRAVARAETSSPALSENLAGDIDGQGKTGFLITGDERFDGTSNIVIGDSGQQSLVHNFRTIGGAGSGGGAGLGGAFFVDSGAVLTIMNTDFKSNRVQGGQGGSTPALRFYDRSLNVAGATVDVLAFAGTSSVPVQIQKVGTDYRISSIKVGSEALPLLNKGSVLTFGSGISTVKSVAADGSVSFSQDLVLGSTSYSSVGLYQAKDPDDIDSIEVSGFSFTDGKTIDFLGEDRNITIAGLKDVTVGSVVVVGTEVTTVKSINYGDDGALARIVLKDTVSTAATGIDLLPSLGFNAANFSESDTNQYTVVGDLGSFKPGMTVSWTVDDEVQTATIQSVSGNGQTITLDRAIPAGVNGFRAVEMPLVGQNDSGQDLLKVTDVAGKFSVGDAVYVPAQDGSVGYSGIVRQIDAVTGIVAIEKVGGDSQLSDLYVENVGVSLRSPSAMINENSDQITILRNPSGDVEEGMLITGAGFAEGTTVMDVLTVTDTTITLQLSAGAIEDAGAIGYFKVFSPLTKGGSMNNLDAVANTEGRDGGNGTSANFNNSFFGDGEGGDGNNGESAVEADNGTGYDGGNGGNGSDGLSVNPALVYDMITATYGFTAAINGVVQAGLSLSAAINPDIVVTFPPGLTAPDPLEITAAQVDLGFAIADLVFATSDLGMVIAQTADWNNQLQRGLAGRGGAGGSGGEGSAGADFFGGGAGGDGGNGGGGGTSTTHGGDGGDGGRGGDGGFGAGGGTGGAGGSGGQYGFAYDGDAGDGGFGGFGAGDGANGNGMFGGGGSGFGGAIFVREGGSLIVQGNAVFELNTSAGGSTSSDRGEAGFGVGSDLFMMKGATVRLEPGLGKEIRFEGDIADDSLATNDGFVNAAGDGADITIAGNGGLVTFNGANTYSGDTILEGATLTALMGEGVNDASRLRFNGAGIAAPALPDNDSTLTLGTAGTFLLQEDYNRRAGTESFETMWTGSGGFASSLAEGSNVILGDLGDGRSQALTWGQDGFFVNAGSGFGAGINGTLTFGSEQSAGSVDFSNNVNLNGNAGRIAVYGDGLEGGYKPAESAVLSGNWTNGRIIVGDGAGDAFNGTLFMTGQNQVSEVQVWGGHLSTYARGETPTFGTLLASGSNLIVNPRAAVSLFGTETPENVAVLPGGTLLLAGTTSVGNGFDNYGTVLVDKGTETSEFTLPEATNADGTPLLTQGRLSVMGKLTNHLGGTFSHSGIVDVGDDLTNLGHWIGTADISEVDGDLVNFGQMAMTADIGSVGESLVNGGVFALKGDAQVSGVVRNIEGARLLQHGALTSASTIVNEGFWRIAGESGIAAQELAGEGVYCLETRSEDSASDTDCAAEDGVATDLTLALSGPVSAFAGTFAGAGSLEKLGNGTLVLTEVQSFAGGLAINAGVVETRDEATLNDALAITVGTDGRFFAGVEDTVASLGNAGLTVLSADITTTGTVVNTGNMTLAADLVAGGTVTNDGVLAVSGAQILSSGGLEGSGLIDLTVGTLTVDQDADSAYSGSIGRLDDDGVVAAGSLTKEGAGILTLNGAAQSVMVNDLVIAGGKIVLDGENLINNAATVDVRELGELELLNGDQRINELRGQGVVMLNDNDLNIGNGGDFIGSVFGTGAINVNSGDFTVAGEVSSTGSDFNINAGSSTTLATGASLTANNMQIVGALHLGNRVPYVGGVEDMTVVTANAALLTGTLTGNGRFTGSVTATGANIRPGNSPGILSFGALELDGGTVVEMEVVDPSGVAGVAFDQTVIAGQFKIGSDSTLNIRDIADGTIVSALGQTTRLFAFGEGDITGRFGAVTADNASFGIFNLATGNLVGLGNRTLASIGETAMTANQRAIYQGLDVSTSGGVAQFYGGHFIEDLTRAIDLGADTDVVYDSYSPASYAALTDAALLAGADVLPKWLGGHDLPDGGFSDIGRSAAAIKAGVENQGYSVTSNGFRAGYAKSLDGYRLVFTLGGVSSRAEGEYIAASGNGLAFGGAILGEIAALENGVWHIGVKHSALDFDGIRRNLRGNVAFANVGTSATEVEVGGQFRKVFGNSYLKMRGSIAVGNARRDGFGETSTGPSTLDAMSVAAQDTGYAVLSLGAEVGRKVSGRGMIFGGLDASIASFGGDEIIIGAYDNGQAMVEVVNDSALTSSVSASVGFRQDLTAGRVEMAVGVTSDWNNDASMVGRLSYRLQF